jgi:antitoxin component YwqK of YwqJK toxin-antitoxin module
MVLSFGCTSGKSGGNASTQEVNQVNDSGKRDGPWEIFSDDVLVARGSYVNGKPDGLWTRWYPSGQMKEEGHYKKGVKDGMWVEWYEDGVVMWKGEWKDGIRQIEYQGAKAEVTTPGMEHLNGVLEADSVYRLRIRIPNIPASNLFVEVSSGEISRETDSDIYILNTPSDSMITLAVGYIPDLMFRDFRNLVSEIEYQLR